MQHDGTTITTYITVPSAAPNDDSESSSGGGGSNNNAKLIGGLVGSIGGTIVIGSLVLLFLYLRRRNRNSLKNQNPDFNDGSDDESLKKGGGFKKLFGSKGISEADMKTFDHVQAPDDAEGDYAYRGVTNSNLDSVFKSSATNSGSNTVYYGSTAAGSTGQNSTRHSRYNSMAYPQAFDEDEEQFNFGNVNHTRDSSGDLEPDEYLSHENLLQENPIFGDGTSNNSRSRFTEEIV